MSDFVSINKDLYVKTVKVKKRSIISVIDGSKEIVLSDLKTSEYFWNSWVSDENYIVAYSRGCMANNIPLELEAVYSIKNRDLVDISDTKVRDAITFMTVCRKGFSLTDVISVIGIDQYIAPVENRKKLIEYLTSGNENINWSQIKKHVLKSYPQLNDSEVLYGTVSIKTRNNLVDTIGSHIWLHAISQDIDFIKNKQKKL